MKQVLAFFVIVKMMSNFAKMSDCKTVAALLFTDPNLAYQIKPRQRVSSHTHVDQAAPSCQTKTLKDFVARIDMHVVSRTKICTLCAKSVRTFGCTMLFLMHDQHYYSMPRNWFIYIFYQGGVTVYFLIYLHPRARLRN